VISSDTVEDIDQGLSKRGTLAIRLIIEYLSLWSKASDKLEVEYRLTLART